MHYCTAIAITSLLLLQVAIHSVHTLPFQFTENGKLLAPPQSDAPPVEQQIYRNLMVAIQMMQQLFQLPQSQINEEHLNYNATEPRNPMRSQTSNLESASDTNRDVHYSRTERGNLVGSPTDDLESHHDTYLSHHGLPLRHTLSQNHNVSTDDELQPAQINRTRGGGFSDGDFGLTERREPVRHPTDDLSK